MFTAEAFKAKKTAACIISLMMLVIVVFSAFYMTAEAGHDCMGENCPVCTCLRQCGHTLRQISGHAAPQPAAFISVVFALLPVLTAAPGLRLETPVSQKVRLNR